MSDRFPPRSFEVESLESRRLLAAAAMAVISDIPVAVDPVGTPGLIIDSPDSVVMTWDDSKTYITTSGTRVDTTLSSFTGPLTADQYSAVIDWGDGSSSAGQIIRNSDGSYAVAGSHDYAAEGNFDVSVEIDATDGSMGFDYHRVFTRADSMVVTAAPELYTTLGDSPSEQDVASFYDPNPAAEEQYQVSIDWGDGSSSAGRVVPSWDGGFDVVGDHGYSDSGQYNLSVTIVKQDNAGQQAGTLSTTGTAQVWEADPIEAAPIELDNMQTMIPTSGTAIHGMLSSFTGTLDASDYTASIDWGDGTTSDARIVQQSDGTFAVVGDHDYGKKGQFDVSVEIDSSDGWTEYDYHSVYTQADPMFVVGDMSVWTLTSKTSDQFYIGSFIDQNGTSDTSVYSVAIDWGDGTNSAGQVQQSWDGTYDVVGDHAYGTSGTYAMSITVARQQSAGGQANVLNATGTADVVDPAQIGLRPIFGLADDGIIEIAGPGGEVFDYSAAADPANSTQAPMAPPPAQAQSLSTATMSIAADVFQTGTTIKGIENSNSDPLS
ncbi:MAG TPA: hypothetical protein VH518_05770 [Tepidisphaeraceae bacterium]|jgi:hypothetical protein